MTNNPEGRPVPPVATPQPESAALGLAAIRAAEDEEWMNAPLGEPRETLPTRLGRLYDQTLVQARAVAREHGYALTTHGSQLRDLDVVAVPWIEGASAPEVLAEAIRERVGGVFTTKTIPQDAPTPRPHGRLGWAITMMKDDARALVDETTATKTPFHPYIDLSVMQPGLLDALARERQRYADLEAEARTLRFVRDEMGRAWDRFGDGSMAGTLMSRTEKLAVMLEEVGEVARAVVIELRNASDNEPLRHGEFSVQELIVELEQTAACAAMWANAERALLPPVPAAPEGVTDGR